jgi:hypothetical protein
MSLCPPAANQLTEKLGGFDCSGPAFVHFRSPGDLSNPTLVVLEILFVLGAVVALVHATRRLRYAGDRMPLGLAIAGVCDLLVTEVPLYFPQKFGIESHVGTTFAHNVFMVDFLHDRLPLYIVSLYVAVPVLAYEVVRCLGVFDRLDGRRGGAFLGALCVGVVHSAFYEVFDHLGPQLRWWAWNTHDKINHPFFAAVPLTSVTLFSLVAPTGMVLLVRYAVRHGIGWAVLAGALVPLTMTIGALPSSVFGSGDHPHTTAQAIVLSIEFGVAWLVALPILVGAWRTPGERPDAVYALGFGAVYLGTMVGLWISALGDYRHALGGITSDGTPIGDLTFATFCAAAATLALIAIGTRPRTAVS